MKKAVCILPPAAPLASKGPTRRRFCLGLAVTLVSACRYPLDNLVMSDTDVVLNDQIRTLRQLTRTLAQKLYLRNPRELHKTALTLEQRLEQLFGESATYYYDEVGRRTGNEALLLAFSPQYRGDRVFAFMVGLKTMLYRAHGLREELYLLDQLDAQSLYHAARNLEIINWRLKNRRRPDGSPYLLSNGLSPESPNLSFERLFGKMIALQDSMARIVAGRDNRLITAVAHNLASSTLLPIGL